MQQLHATGTRVLLEYTCVYVHVYCNTGTRVCIVCNTSMAIAMDSCMLATANCHHAWRRLFGNQESFALPVQGPRYRYTRSTRVRTRVHVYRYCNTWYRMNIAIPVLEYYTCTGVLQYCTAILGWYMYCNTGIEFLCHGPR